VRCAREIGIVFFMKRAAGPLRARYWNQFSYK